MRRLGMDEKMAEVRYLRDGAVVVLELSNPGRKNALSYDMAIALASYCDELDRDDTVGCVIVRGEGGTFCSGADTTTWTNLYENAASDEAYRITDQIYNAFVRIGQLKMPTIAAVRGASVGAGINLALSTNLRIAADNARFLAGFLNASIHPGGGFLTLATRLCGAEAATAMGLFSAEVSGKRAVEIGLAWESVPDEQVEERALELATKVSRDRELARVVVRSLQLETWGPPLTWGAALEAERGAQMWSQTRRVQRAAKSS
jgi:enoyl-CoA hydratase